jgi:alanine or glycine:cation symporter, AGCS family
VPETIDQQVDRIFAQSTGWFVNLIFAPLPFTIAGVSFPWIVMWLVVGATIFTIYFRFIQFRAFGHALALVSGDYSEPQGRGRGQPFPGAGHGAVGHGRPRQHRRRGGGGVDRRAGGDLLDDRRGPARHGLEVHRMHARREIPQRISGRHRLGRPDVLHLQGLQGARHGRGGKMLAILFAIFCVLGSLGGGNMFQANQAHAQLVNITGGAESFLNGNGWITGLILAGVVFAVIVGGIKSIARVTEKVVPFMGMIYVGTALLIVLIVNYDMHRLGLRADLRRAPSPGSGSPAAWSAR